jgi:predicted nucleic acid-binding protein
MSCDLGVWYPQRRMQNKEAGELYSRLCEGDTSGVTPNPAIDAFYAELTSKHPEIDAIPEEKAGDLDYCPWSCKLDRSPGHVIMSCVWPKATYVGDLVKELAREHGLAVYDPQSDVVTYPDGSTGAKAAGRAPRWALGVLALLFAAIFIYTARVTPEDTPRTYSVVYYVFAALCVLLAGTCFKRAKE